MNAMSISMRQLYASSMFRTASRRLSSKRQLCPCVTDGGTIQRTQLVSSFKYHTQRQRFNFSAIPSPSTLSATCAIENTPLDSPNGTSLLKGLDIHTVHAEDDGHPLAVYTMKDDAENSNDTQQQRQRTPVLLLHGRTWSSLPVYHLIGSNSNGSPSNDGKEDVENTNRSLIQALYNTSSHNVQPYSMDFRGFGGTPKDASGFVEPLKCVSDVVSVLNWIHSKHTSNGTAEKGGESDSVDADGQRSLRPALLGWSHGALIAQITAQRHSDALSKLIL